MQTTVKGRYKNGVVELVETPVDAQEGEVLVTFPEDIKHADLGALTMIYGQYAGGRQSTEEDFKMAEWHGEDEFD